MGRAEILRSMFDGTGKELEIGPSHNPLMPKAAGWDLEVLDYLDARGLRQKYATEGVDVSAIEDVDHVSDGRPMPEVIGDRHRYDWIVASHVIEHVPDLLGFLNDCETLLKPGGCLVLAVPDKRCCFDILRPISSVGQVLQAHVDGRTRPPPGVIFDDVAYARKRRGHISWPLGDPAPLEDVRPLEAAWHRFLQACQEDSHIDMHCWVFVPTSFRLILRTLAVCGRTGLREVTSRLAESEFYTVISSAAAPETLLEFGALAEAAQVEEHQALTTGLAETDVARLRDELASTRIALAKARKRETALTASTSWILTAPLRAIVRRVKR